MADDFDDIEDDSQITTETDIWASPGQEQAQPQPKTPRTPRTPKTPTGPSPVENPPEIDREAALRKELEGVRNVNDAIEGIIETLKRTEGNMGAVSQTVDNASTLLNTWTRILSQTEHNQRLLLHPGWKGATADMAEQEQEMIAKQQALERQAAQAEERRREAQRRREEEEEARRLASTTPGRGVRRTTSVRGTRTRPRGSRGASSSGYGADTGAPSSRAGSNIGRGLGSTRGRPRGTR